VRFASFSQTAASPLIVPGVAIVLLMLATKQEGAEVIPQLFVAVTHILPPLFDEVTLMDAVPCPLFIVQPEGTVHV
jgi:hypothetical protein